MSAKKIVFEKRQNVIQSAVAKGVSKVLTNLNLNTILLAVIAGYFGIKNDTMATKQDDALVRQQQTQAWQAKRDSINKIMFAKQDSILTILKRKHR